MTVATTTNRKEYVGNGVTTTFAYDFKIPTAADLNVYLGTTLKTLTTDYSVTGAGSPTGGNVVFVTAPAAAAIITIIRSIARTQATALPLNGSFPSTEVEQALDKVTQITQELDETLTRALKFSPTSTFKNINVPDLLASKYLRVNGTANGLELIDLTTAGSYANPVTTQGDLIQGSATGAQERLAVGAADDLLTVSGGKAAWSTTASRLATILTTRGDILVRNATTAVRKALGAKGGLLASDGTDPQWHAIGANDAVLVADSVQANGVKWAALSTLGPTILDRVTAAVEVVNTAAETTVYMKQIDANVIGTNRALRLLVTGDYLNNNGAGGTIIVKAKYGATTIYNSGAIAGAFGASANRCALVLDVTLMAAGATNAQRARGVMFLHGNGVDSTGGSAQATNPSFYLPAIHNAVAEDSTANKSLVVTITLGVASVNLSAKLYTAILEYL